MSSSNAKREKGKGIEGTSRAAAREVHKEIAIREESASNAGMLGGRG